VVRCAGEARAAQALDRRLPRYARDAAAMTDAGEPVPEPIHVTALIGTGTRGSIIKQAPRTGSAWS